MLGTYLNGLFQEKSVTPLLRISMENSSETVKVVEIPWGTYKDSSKNMDFLGVDTEKKNLRKLQGGHDKKGIHILNTGVQYSPGK